MFLVHSKRAKRATLAVIALLGVGREARALPFDFKDPKEISAVSLTLDSKFEPIVGYAKGISGTVDFDPKKPLAANGKIAVDAASVQFANEGYTATAQNFALQKDKYPQLFLAIRKVVRVRKINANRYEGVVKADFTCRGIATRMLLPVTASYFAGKAEERTNGKYRGDLLVIRAHFDVSRKRYGISEGIPDSMVGDTVTVGVAVVGIHYAPGQQNKPAPPKTISRSVEKSEAWQIEVENRDDPAFALAAFERDAAAPAAIFTTQTGTLRADRVIPTADSLRFHLPENPLLGEADGQIVFSGETLTGEIRGKSQRYKIHGRRKRQAASRPARSLPGEKAPLKGLAALKIVRDGKSYSLPQRMEFYGVPAISIARFEHFALTETITLGVKDADTGQPADNETRFAAGGMGTTLVSVLALKLAAAGKLELERDVDSYLSEGRPNGAAPRLDRRVKVIDLINLTSGLTQYKFAGYRPGVAAPTLQDLIEGADPDEMEPLDPKGETGKFNGAGTNGALLERVIEIGVGRSFPDLMRENVFGPFGMEHSAYAAPDTAKNPADYAVGHYSTGERMLDGYHLYPERGETGLWTTDSDFAKALIQIQRLKAGQPNQILGETQAALFAKVTQEPALLGLIRSRKGDFLPEGYYYHGGDPYGFYCNYAAHAEDGSGVVVMMNRIMGWRLCNDIIQAALSQKKP